MTPNYSSQPSIDKSDWRLFVLFVSPEPFFGNSILSLLIYAEEHLFLTVTESADSSIFARTYSLADDYHPIVFQHQWFYERAWSPTVSIIPQANSNYVLCWDFGTETNARHLLKNRNPLKNLNYRSRIHELVRVGMYLTGSGVAAITYEPSPNSSVNLSITKNEKFDLDRMPLVLSSRLSLSDEIVSVAYDSSVLSSRVERPVFLSHLGEQLPKFDTYSIFVDEYNCINCSYYRLPNCLLLTKGDKPIFNCLSSVRLRVKSEELSPYAVSVQTAGDELMGLLTDFKSQALEPIRDWLGALVSDNWVSKFCSSASVEEKEMWSDLDRECLLARSCLTFRSLHDPEALEQQILGLLSKFQELVETDQFASFRARDAASRIIVIIQNVFRVRNLDTSEAVAQLVEDLQSFNKLEQFSSLSANNIDLFDRQK